MPDPATELRIADLQKSPADQINSLRLISDGNTLSLASMTASPDGMHDVSTRSLETDSEGVPRSLGKLSSPFGLPFWDVGTVSKGLATVWTMPGSAISSLGYQVQGHQEITLTGRYPSGVFQNPRFVRGHSSLAVTACAMQSAGEALVLFQDGLETGNARYRILPAAGQGRVLDGLLVRNGNGYLLLAKYAAPFPGVSQRTDLRGESSAGGVLRCLWLDADFHAVDSASSPFGDSAVFEFDADANDEHIYLIATTPQGFMVAATTIEGKAWHWIFSPEAQRSGETLFSPAVSAQSTSANAVFLSKNEAGSRDIMRARISIRGR